MNIVIVHYHLNRGGVGQVISSHLRGLQRAVPCGERWRIALAYGGRREGWPDDLETRLGALELEHWTIRDLDYAPRAPAAPRLLALQFEEKLRGAGFDPQTTLIHAHNHALGKNASLPGCLAYLAARGYRMLLQLHDFVEDFRPQAYAALWQALGANRTQEFGLHLYPQADQIHYAVLNQRDARILARAGLEPARLHVLPNPVADLGPSPSQDQARKTWCVRWGAPLERRLFLYPVRGIARKNLGEMLLWSALAGDEAHFGTSLAPLNPAEQPLYERWRQLATELKLNCTFEIGAPGGLSLADSMAAADRFLTTSLAEGFGMVFLESWRAGRQLTGRDLPEITADFVRAGIQFDLLHRALWVPVEWIGMDEFRASIAQAFRGVMQLYRRGWPESEARVDDVCGLIQDECVDFGSLNALQQQSVIRQVCSTQERDGILARNGWMQHAMMEWNGELRRVAERNARIVRTNYSLEGCGHMLMELYRQVISSPYAANLEGLPRYNAVLDAFLRLERFRPLRTEP